MLPIRHSSLFRSRWLALVWAVGICWTAISFVTPSSDDEGANDTNATAVDSAADLNHLQALVGQLQKAQH